ncbi:hypothetical protein FOC4_g10011241 [Fusarium odoratissimum]|uniref:Uncharacterized protein n=1 Tax=Fusarium oxysporum f. sp. cubense (strain race 4) TaxID=2502994 RepID=N1RF90_FUSC4|nr:hypothetical protein FOC4_g10011241 [Fusarium odoratissimum]
MSISGIATWCVPKRRGTIDSKTRDCVTLCKRLEHYVCSALWFPVRRFSWLSAFSSSGKQYVVASESILAHDGVISQSLRINGMDKRQFRPAPSPSITRLPSMEVFNADGAGHSEQRTLHIHFSGIFLADDLHKMCTIMPPETGLGND